MRRRTAAELELERVVCAADVLAVNDVSPAVTNTAQHSALLSQ